MALPPPPCRSAGSSHRDTRSGLTKSAMGVVLTCLVTASASLALRFDWRSDANAITEPASLSPYDAFELWENRDNSPRNLTRFLWTKSFELRDDGSELNSGLWYQHEGSKLSHAKAPALELPHMKSASNTSHFKAFAGPIDIHVQMLVHAGGAPSLGSCPDYYMGPRFLAARNSVLQARGATPIQTALGKRIDSRVHYVPWEDSRPDLKKQKSEVQQLKVFRTQKHEATQGTTSIEELVKLLVKIDSDEDRDAKRSKVLKETENPFSFGELNDDFSGLEGKLALENADQALFSKQEKLDAGSLNDFVKFMSVVENQEALRTRDSAVDHSKEDACSLGESDQIDIDLSSEDIHTVESALEVTTNLNSAGSMSPDHELTLSAALEQEPRQQIQIENPPSAVLLVEESVVGAPVAPSSSQLLRFDSRIFVPNFTVRIEGGTASERNQPSRPPFISWTSSFLAGPTPPPATATPSISRKTRVQRWQDTRKLRSKAKPSDSYVSEVRRAGAATKPRSNGRFISTGARFVSVTSLQP